MERPFTMTYSTSISNLCEVNSSFDAGVLRICYAGENRNGSYISKEDLVRAIPTLYNCPIVCHYTREDDSIGGHDMEVVSDDKYGLRLVNLTQPVGVIPESSNVYFENVVEEDGSEHEYLCAEALIWKRQEAYEKIKNNGVTSHSMEISVKSGEKDDDGLYHIEDFEFTAFALIGVEPCFEGSSITMFSNADAKAQLEEMMKDLKDLNESFSVTKNSPDGSQGFNEATSTPSVEVDSVENKTFETKGGENILDEKNELLKKYNLVKEDLDFEIDEMSIEDLETAIQNFVANKQNVPNESENEGAEYNNASEDNDEDAENFELEGAFRDELMRVLEGEELQMDGYSICHYWFVDYDKDADEVYFIDREDYLLYGAEYERNGDDITIKYDTKKRMKYTIVPHETGDVQFSHIHDEFCNEFNEMHKNIAELSEDLNNANNELKPLREFKASVVNTEKKELLSTFTDLDGDEKFEEIKANADDMSIEDIEEKCYALRGRKNTTFAKVEKKSAPKLTVNRNEEDDYEPYHGAFKRYGFNK